MSDPQILIAPRVKGSEDRLLVAGAEEGGSCCRCGEALWLAPSSRKLLAGEGGAEFVLMCEECGLPDVLAEIAATGNLVVKLAPGGAAEITATRRRN